MPPSPRFKRISVFGDRSQHVLQETRHNQVKPQQNHNQRNRAEYVDVELRQTTLRAQSWTGASPPAWCPRQYPITTAVTVIFSVIDQPVEQIRQGRNNGTPVKLVHHLLPMLPGRRTLRSTSVITSMMTALINTYASVMAGKPLPGVGRVVQQFTRLRCHIRPSTDSRGDGGVLSPGSSSRRSSAGR